MRLYERYVDDSNQVAEVPPPGSKYDKERKKVVYDEREHALRIDEDEEDRLTRILVEIANEVQPGIIMEADHPNQNADKKLPILDMEVWINQDHFVVYQHYEKPVTSRRVLAAQSAQATTCKRSVHVRELVRRILNTSSRLEWDPHVASVLTDYLARMMNAGYNEYYRKVTLDRALAIYDRMKQNENDGIQPVNRPKDWQLKERRKKKTRKERCWATRGGYIAPIIIPSTPNSELLKMLREVAGAEAEPGLKFKIVERGGVTVKRQVQNSNPTG